ncbi:molecular chaperone GrpE [Candidatus Kinetoplastibacterium desouzaii TCC079E]|uniref:Protein GrpE n=1 Tax=Candidatus Kinetoplastidibacterium desouzai TCC079E TaxID=1208919 RepID=M1M4D1_9PROT|nr:nucleotide exchange factor GrpE [Candidatus Kinetoplastibacterium desouzaii]AGF47075.1 molecular chaperone GrpE [Candidatus Kinetoplastibacterium desouzaii TCC079E]
MDIQNNIEDKNDIELTEVDNESPLSETTISLEEKITSLLGQIGKLETIVKDQNDKILRISAEMENTRKRSQEEISKVRKFGIESFAESLVPVKDSLEAALNQENQTVEHLTEGLIMTLKQFDSVFKNNMLKEINPNLGDKFDPSMHQAISSIESDYPSNTIAELLQKGYVIYERVLRPALVIVSSSNKTNDN